MKASQVLIVSAIVSSALALDKVVKFPVTKTTKTSSSKLAKRDQDISDTLSDDHVSYFANIQVGTPAQTVRIIVDTGSSDLWFPSVDNVNCPKGTATPIENYDPDFDYCLRQSEFDQSSSSTWKPDYNVPGFSIKYASGDHAIGTWGTDTVKWNDVSIEEFFLASANDSNTTPVFGIALAVAESSNYAKYGSSAFEYKNWPERLKSDGYIDKVVYSLYADQDPATVSGDTDVTILFGGVDSAKYTGSLVTFAMDSAKKLEIPLTGISTHYSGTTTAAGTTTYPGLLDTGTTNQHLPSAFVKQIALNLGGSGDTDDYGSYIVPCNYNSDDYLIYEFGSQKTIKIPISDLVYEYSSQCGLNLKSTTKDHATLGDTFLTHAYIVYDLEDLEISIAQASYSTDEDIQPVVNTIPGATQATSSS